MSGTQQLAREMHALLGEGGVVDDPVYLSAYEFDGLAMHRQRPELVCLPRTTEEAMSVMGKLHRLGVPVVSRGAGTGLSGGATPVEGGVIVGTSRMRDLVELNIDDRFARVQAGMVNVDLTGTCAHHGLFYAPDPSSQMACTIGGNVGENSGGPHCFRYGSTTRHILGLKIIRHDGCLLDLSGPSTEPLGYDLAGLFIGSEGTFGLCTEVTVKLLPKPEVEETLLGIFKDLDDACDSVSHIIRERLEPSALEILDRLTIEAVEDSVFAAGYPRDAEAVLLLDVEGSRLEVDSTAAAIQSVLAEHDAIEVRRAQTALERKQLWAGRKGAFGAMGRIAPDLYVADVVAPRTRLREVVQGTTEICRERGLKLANVFHAGDGNMHPNICYDRRNTEEVERVLDAGHAIMKLCVDLGGALTGEHGVGLEKQDALDLLFTPEDLSTMCKVRDVWDPNRRMNPDKLIPLRSCMEIRQASLGQGARREGNPS